MELVGNVAVIRKDNVPVNVNYPLSGDGTQSSPITGPENLRNSQPTLTTLWETDTPFRNLYSIQLSDSIDNYDEIWYYGTANRGTNVSVNCVSEYPVYKGAINQGGPYYCGQWETTNYYFLSNGTQMFLSGTSGYIEASYYWGMQNAGTAFEANRYTSPRGADVHPYKIVGVKY